ncbi:MAG TPA: methionyl-tRNA formyltransferase [Vicinamibacterales bacterium]|nr:methionyl-tRNA formyltransferase [Vicinamibacterales bacterium]
MVTSSSLRIVFFGTPDFAVPTLKRLIESEDEVVAAVSQPDRPRGRGHQVTATPTKVLALERGVPALQPARIRDEAFLAQMRELRPDLGVVAAYGKLLPDELLQIPRLGMINVHASLLPRWRGAAPVHRAVIAGDAETGVTIMRVVKELDAGPMFAKVVRPIADDETSADVERDLAVRGAELLATVIRDMAAGRAVETPQDSALVTYAPKIEKAEGAVEWSLPAARLHNLVRGLQPWPLVSTRIAGSRVLIHKTALTTALTPDRPGTIVRAEADRFEIAAGDGRVLRLLVVQPEGRRPMTAREFLAGRSIPQGTKVERG